MICATVAGGGFEVEGNGEIGRVQTGGRAGHDAPRSIGFGIGFEARRMGTCEAISSRVSYPLEGGVKRLKNCSG